MYIRTSDSWMEVVKNCSRVAREVLVALGAGVTGDG